MDKANIELAKYYLDILHNGKNFTDGILRYNDIGVQEEKILENINHFNNELIEKVKWLLKEDQPC